MRYLIASILIVGATSAGAAEPYLLDKLADRGFMSPDGRRLGVIEPRPGNPSQLVIKDDQGRRQAIIKPRPGNPGQFVIEDTSGRRVGVIN